MAMLEEVSAAARATVDRLYRAERGGEEERRLLLLANANAWREHVPGESSGQTR